MAGNLLGRRRYFSYTTDSGIDYKYLTDEDLGTAIGAVLNDTNPDMPRRLVPRIVHCRDAAGNKKRVIVPTVGNSTYAADATSDITIDGTVFSTTGRRGEQLIFGTNN